MPSLVEISYRGVAKSDEIDNLIRTKAERLDRFCDHITRCDVAVEQPNQSQREGNPFRVRVDVRVPPGHELVADEKQTEHEMHEPLTKIIKRRVQDHGATAEGSGRAPAARSEDACRAARLDYEVVFRPAARSCRFSGHPRSGGRGRCA